MIRLTPFREVALKRHAASESRNVEAARLGDREAFDTLVAAHQQDIRKFISKRIPKEAVDDLTQEIFLAAWTSISEFDSRSRFKTWLYGIAINKCKSLHRNQSRRMPALALADLAVEPAQASEIHQPTDMEAKLSELIERLPENHRQLLDLYYYGELTLPEISKLLERNLNTVKYQFYRAHTELSNLLKEDGRR